MKRNRILYCLLIIAVVILGLLSRKFPEYLPEFIASYSGDFLWALMVFLGFGMLFNKQTTLKIVLYSLAFSFAIEFSQLYQADWIVNLRTNKLAALVLGHGFLWSDLLCYTAGIFVGAGIETYLSPTLKDKTFVKQGTCEIEEKDETPQLFEGRIITSAFKNKIGKELAGISDNMFRTKNESYFIKLSESKISIVDVERLMGEEISIEGEIRDGLWDTDDPNVQSRIGNYIVIFTILEKKDSAI